MFPLFRKGKEAPPPATAVKDRKAPADAVSVSGPPTISLRDGKGEAPASSTGGIQVHESELHLPPEVEEAVMHYASGHAGEAAAALNRFILNKPDSRDALPWRLLFDIYEATQQRQAFEDMALDYAMRFESSPPTWQPVLAKPSTVATANKEPAFQFSTSFSPQDKVRLQQFFQECEKSDSAAVDFSKSPVPATDAQAQPMLDCLKRLLAMGKAVRLIGGEAFLVRINASRTDKRLSEPAWHLLLLILQLLGKIDEFEEAAIEFAIHFEISPPSYAAPKRRAEIAEAETSQSTIPTGDGFSFRGVLSAESAADFEALREYAGKQSQVEIDFSQVSRVDFAIVGVLMDTLINLAQSGKQTVIKEANDMVSLFLNMVGVGQFTTIQTRKRK